VQRLQRLRDHLQAQVAQKGLGSKVDTPADAGLAELCQALPQGAALLDFVHYIDYRPVEGGVRLTRKMAAVAVRQRDCRAQVVALGDAKPVQTAVQEWRKALAVQGAVRGAAALGIGEPAQAAPWHGGAQALWGQLIAPVVDHLQGVEVLVISPDDALHFVPWPALMDPQGKLLADHWPVALVDSPGQLLAQRPQPGPTELAGTSALLIGGPAFGKAPKARGPSRGADACASLLSTTWAPLPGTLGEAKAGGEVLRKAGVAVETLTGAAATEAALRKAAPGRRWISLATHGYFAGAACARNADLTPRDPLLLSGLVFAGANQPGAAAGDDGWLTAAEIAALDLRGTELVVLSACETGLGDAQQAVGEGVFGLRQAFARAGAAGVVLSLWQVPDRETADLLGAFWRRMAATPQRPWLALHAAQAELRAKLAAQGRDHPQLWAGFAYAGQP
jgi:CHAT domain-containing protein